MRKLAILSNINIDPLKNQLQKIDSFEFYVAGYNQWQSELLKPHAGLSMFKPDVIFLYLNAEELQQEIQDVISCIETYLSKNERTQFLVSTISYPPYSVETYAQKNSQKTTDFNDSLRGFSTQNKSVFVLDFNRLISLHGYKTLFDEKYWYLGRIKFSTTGFNVLANELKNVLNCWYGKTKKALVVDLDNTIWGGVVGEDGWQNLQLSNEGIGLIYLDFQKKLKALQQTGVLLAICSKNNEKEVREVFEKNTNMILKWDDFVAHFVNWEQKSDNLVALADSLSLGLDSFVFIDDSPRERELVQQTLNEVTVPDFPTDFATLNRWFVIDVVYPYFAKTKFTNEDLQKTNQYKRNIDRNEIKQKLDYKSFLAQLEIKLTIAQASVDVATRIAQLTQKTNQFNLTGKRYTEVEIGAMLANPNMKIFTCEYDDKFGKEGLIGCAIINTAADKAEIDTFLLSCRVLGREVEFQFLNHLINELNKENITIIEATFNETPRNSMAKGFYTKRGFASSDNQCFILKLT